MEFATIEDLPGGVRDDADPRARIQGGVHDADRGAPLWDDGRFDVVYHVATCAAEHLSHVIRAYNYRTNVEPIANLTDHGDAERFAIISPIGVTDFAAPNEAARDLPPSRAGEREAA